MTTETEDLRERVARIVDPEAWAIREYNLKCEADRLAWNTMEGTRQAPGFRAAADKAVKTSLAQADFIIELFAARTQAAEKALEEAREIARCAKASATEAERLLGEYQLRALKAESALDEAGKALAKWPCPGCGGKKVYVWQQTAVPCKVCEETGIHPIARSALGTPS